MRTLAVLLALAGAVPGVPAQAQNAAPTGSATGSAEIGGNSNVVLEAGTGRVFRVRGTTSSLFAADPKVVEVRVASPNSIFIFGVGPGRSTVAALDEAGNPIAQFDVTVRSSQFSATEAADQARATIPGATGLRFNNAPASFSVSGRVGSPLAGAQTGRLVAGYLGEKQNLDDRTSVDTAVQVTLRVRIAEISRTITRQFGINWTSLANIGRWSITGSFTDGLNQTSNLPMTVGTTWAAAGSSINTVLDLLAQDQLITLLAEPNLTARSGETASFLAGGEFPIPVAGANGEITVAFKSYGVSLAFVPTVLSDGRISLKVHPEVSQLTNVGAVSVPIVSGIFGTSNVTIPAITVRRAETTVEIGSGQSFAVAGLLSANATMNARGLPFLGELPVIGPLFKSDLFLRDQSELVIVVTPYLVKPVSHPGVLRAPTDDFVPAGDVDRVLFNRQRARGTGPAMVVAPSVQAFAPGAGLQPASLPAGTGFTLH